MVEISDIDPLAIRDIVADSSILALEFFRTSMDVQNKLDSGFDPVTEMDRRVESVLRQALADHIGELPVIGEEQGTTGDPSSGLAWIIDPIDGTRAYISGQPQWGTLLGLLSEGHPIAGWMHLPVLGESYWALGSIAGLDSPTSARFGTSGCSALTDATIAATHPSMFTGEMRASFDRLEAAVRLSRYGGDCHNYGLLATGDLDLVVESQLQPYDILPLIAIVEAAGGIVTDLHGATPLTGGTVIAAATPQLHAAAIRVLGR